MKHQIWTICMSACVATLMSPSVLAAEKDKWQFTLSPLFIWGVSIDGTATIGDETAPLDLDFQDDILENMDAVITFHFEAGKDKLTLFTEYQYVDLTPDILVGPVEADIEFENTLFELGAAWALSENDTTRWEVLGGVRYTDQVIDDNITVSFPSPPVGPGPQEVEVKGGDDWWHGFVGGRVIHKFTNTWSIEARADYGYGDSDNTAVNAVFFVDYRFNSWGSAFIGVKYMDYDYDNGKDTSTPAHYTYDAEQVGPLLGLNIHW